MGHGCLDGWVLKAGYLGASPACARGMRAGMARGEKSRRLLVSVEAREGRPVEAFRLTPGSPVRGGVRGAPPPALSGSAVRCPPWPRTAMRDARVPAPRPNPNLMLHPGLGALGRTHTVLARRRRRVAARGTAPSTVAPGHVGTGAGTGAGTGGFLHAAHVNRLSAPDLLPSKHHTWAMHGDRPRRAHDMAHLGRARARLRGGHVVLHLVKWTIDSP